ncbi:uncharacterized protein LOC131613640 [Vicia villosa]|uniref:uncharacterized protein LOC131613640 n=1 Tax=Vicia villosa TaxID=3911 RepID=UPI00273AB647|nr:uncharacterized protein LOC131613640 [Vicia villosa]
MDDNNQDMVGLLAREMNSIFSPSIQNLNRTNQDNSETCQQLSVQMGQIENFLGASETLVRRRTNQIVIQEDEPTINQVRPPRPLPETEPLRAGLEQQPVRQEIHEEQPKRVVMVDRNQNVDEVIHRIRQNNKMENNLTAMIERIIAQMGCKIPKFTKFSGDTSESTIEHIARYMTEAGDLANNEDLRMMYFPSSLTKNAFTWFTTLPPNSLDTRSHLERFRLLKARCFTVVPEHELFEMAAGGLDYSIRKKLDTQYL